MKEMEREQMSQDELRRMRRMSYIKMVAIFGFIIAVIAFSSIAWFTMNREVEGSGMNMKASESSYLIVTETEGENGNKKSKYHAYQESLHDGDASVWIMTADHNMKNYAADDVGISPGSYGSVTFYVVPNSDAVTLDLDFRITGYSEDSGTLTPADTDVNTYLMGHIQLFEERTTVGNPEDEKFIYSKPILSGNEFSRVISRRTFTSATKDQPVVIYWTWPRTLSTLVDVTQQNANVSISPFCNKTDGTESTDSSYKKVVDHIIANPAYYFYQYTDTAELTEARIINKYEKFGELYDLADNDIGMHVQYITLKMTTSESTAQ